MEEQQIYFGFKTGAYILDLLEDIPDLAARYPYALVTCVDSKRNFVTQSPPWQEILKFVEEHAGTCRPRGPYVLIHSPQTLLAFADRFFGEAWDEVCFFEEEPIELPPLTEDFFQQVHLTSETPVVEYPEKMLDVIRQWMRSSGCVLALGDGNGLNIASTDKRMLDFLLSQ